MTSAQWFSTQHVQRSPKRCSVATTHINQYTKRCKNLNTFLHDSFSSVTSTCQTPNIACKNGRENCHQSPKLVPLTSGKYPNCRYNEKQQVAFFIIACDPSEKRDIWKFPLVPVHLDKVF